MSKFESDPLSKDSNHPPSIKTKKKNDELTLSKSSEVVRPGHNSHHHILLRFQISIWCVTTRNVCGQQHGNAWHHASPRRIVLWYESLLWSLSHVRGLENELFYSPPEMRNTLSVQNNGPQDLPGFFSQQPLHLGSLVLTLSVECWLAHPSLSSCGPTQATSLLRPYLVKIFSLVKSEKQIILLILPLRRLKAFTDSSGSRT